MKWFNGGWLARMGMVGLGAVILFAPIPTHLLPATQHHFRIEATTSQLSPAVLSVNPGDTVTIELDAMDVVHGLSIDGYGVNLTADPGQPRSISFVANQAGTFHIRCSVPCGALHPFISGRLVVGPNWILFRGLSLVGLAGLGGLLFSRRDRILPQPAQVSVSKS